MGLVTAESRTTENDGRGSQVVREGGKECDDRERTGSSSYTTCVPESGVHLRRRMRMESAACREQDADRILSSGCCISPAIWRAVLSLVADDAGPERDCARELKLVKRHGNDAERWVLIPLER